MWHHERENILWRAGIPRVEAAHEVVALHSTIHDGVVSLLVDTLLGNLGINPVGVTPHVRSNLAKLDAGGGVVLDRLLESIVEVAIVEENIRVVVPAVEVTLDRLHRLDNTIQLLVSCEDDKGGVGAGLAGVRFETSRHKHLVVLFADFPVRE